MSEVQSVPPADRSPAAIRAGAMKELLEATESYAKVDLKVGSLVLQIDRTPDNESLYIEM